MAYEDLRNQRFSILDERGGRRTGRRSPSYRGEAMHYREDLGTTMDDATYELTQLGGYDEKLQELAQKGEASEIRVYNKGDYIKSYYLPHEEAEKYANAVNADTRAITRAIKLDKAILEEGADAEALGFKTKGRNRRRQDQAGVKSINPDNPYAPEAVYSWENERKLGYENPSDAYWAYEYSGDLEHGTKGYRVDLGGYGDIHLPLKEAYLTGKQSYSDSIMEAAGKQRQEKLDLLSQGGKQAGLTKQEIDRQYAIIAELMSENKDKTNTVKSKYKARLESMRDTINAIFEGNNG